MAEVSMFENQLNPDLLLNDSINQKAKTKAQLLPGRMGVYSASQAGDRLGTRIGGMMGLERPEVAQQQNLEAILQKYPKMDTPEKMLEAASDLRNAGFLEYSQKMVENATNLRNSQTTQTQTTYMQDLRDIAQFQLACDFNDPECAKKAQELWLNQKRAGADERGDITYAENEMEAFSQSLTQSTDDYQKALYYGNTIDQSLGFLDSGLYTGTGAETVNKFKQFGMAFGMVDPGATATAEQFKVNSMKAIMAWVQKTKGAISEAEMELFANASEGLARSKAGNKLILMTAKSLADYQKNLHRERLRWEETTVNPTRRKWLTHKANWDLENANTVPSAADVAAALQSSEVQSKVIENENVVITIVPNGG